MSRYPAHDYSTCDTCGEERTGFYFDQGRYFECEECSDTPATSNDPEAWRAAR